ncbi:MAG: hypothetical protein Ct9H300mP2_4810 [Candidatus Neomarinimicrobiota bacterium]|nr:MAG: hypothetical protein Ct9H300mP2_4810 [Candidatus Neomarinimicrobiota bacterium]
MKRMHQNLILNTKKKTYRPWGFVTGSICLRRPRRKSKIHRKREYGFAEISVDDSTGLLEKGFHHHHGSG